MERFVAFLRGMNLGGRRVRNDELRRLVGGLGFQEVETFRASGNVILSAEGGTPELVSERLESGLAEGLGYEVPVFLRDEAELLAMAESRPFAPADLEVSQGKLQVVLLQGRPPAEAARTALALASDEDRLSLEGRELYWLPSGGISESALDLRAIEASLGATTIRTKGTIEQIAARHLG